MLSAGVISTLEIVCSIIVGLSPKPILLSKNALTAASLAPLSTAGAVPPISKARYASFKQGKRVIFKLYDYICENHTGQESYLLVPQAVFASNMQLYPHEAE